MFALPIFMPRFKSINFYQSIPKTKLFLQKNEEFFCTEGSTPRPPKHFPIANFWLRAWCFYCCYVILCKPIMRLAGVYGFPQAAFSLNKFAHP